MIDRMRKYPPHLIDVMRLANGSRITVRPALPQDAELQRAFVRSLSEEARYFRFMTRLKELPDAMAERFTRIDYRSHVALIATHFAGPDETMIGEARYIVDECDATACEFAVAVADSWQGLGVARSLLTRLMSHAASSGISRIGGDTLAINKAMIALAKRAGFAAALKPGDGRLVRLVKDLPVKDHHPSVSGRPFGNWVAAA